MSKYFKRVHHQYPGIFATHWIRTVYGPMRHVSLCDSIFLVTRNNGLILPNQEKVNEWKLDRVEVLGNNEDNSFVNSFKTPRKICRYRWLIRPPLPLWCIASLDRVASKSSVPLLVGSFWRYKWMVKNEGTHTHRVLGASKAVCPGN